MPFGQASFRAFATLTMSLATMMGEGELFLDGLSREQVLQFRRLDRCDR